jgi:hypothetical protein
MSKQRIIKDEIWDDDWFYELDPSEKLVWVFLLTNPRGNIAGVYKLNKKWASQATGLDFDVFNTILSRFVKDGKILDEENWIGLVNFHKHVAYRNASVAQGILRLCKESTGCPQALYSVWLTLLNSTLLYLSVGAEKSAQVLKLVKDYESEIMSFKNMRRYKGEEGGYDEVSVQTDPDYKPKKKSEKKVSEDIQAVFDLFNNPASALWRMREIERVAAQTLFETYGLEKLKIRVERIQDEAKKKDPLFPHITTPSQLLDKMPNVERYLNV